jgi:hypothetical protein
LFGRLVGWVVVYAFALNVMLAAAVATQMTAGVPGDPFAICDGGGSSPHKPHGGDGNRIDHQSCAICTIASFALPLPETSGPAAILTGAAAAFQPAATSAAAAQGRHSPRSSQGPPQNV